MRGFIKFCGGLFVVAGMIGCVLALIGGIGMASQNAGGMAMLAVMALVAASAGVTLIGGASYILCRIDERLEKFESTAKAS